MERNSQRRRIFQLKYLFLASFLYGLWWNLIDATPGIGNLMGWHYQLVNGVGHFLPGLAFILLNPKRWEISFSGGLLSSIVMDSPLWGLYQQYLYKTLPWGYDWITWSSLYFNPFADITWWYLYTIPVTSQVMFWSVVIRIVSIVILVIKDFREKSSSQH